MPHERKREVDDPALGLDAGKTVEPKAAELAIRCVVDVAELFHDATDTAYAVVAVRERKAVFKLRSTTFRKWLAHRLRAELGTSVASGVIEEVLLGLEGFALYDGQVRHVYLRVAEHEGAIYVDLGDDSGACIKVTADCWAVLDTAPVLFFRPAALRPLPRPVPGGSLADLRPYVNSTDDDALHLLVAWMVSALRPRLACPILAFHGEQGTAKTTASRVVRRLLDPNAFPLRAPPRKEEDLAVACVHSHVLAFDNVSGIAPWLADALCRVTTGGGVSRRTLYSDDCETVLDATRPIIVNGIDDFDGRADLTERCLVLTLAPIPKKARRDEGSFWRAFDAAAPAIFGYLLTGVAGALRDLPAVELPELPRMADFARWIAAAEHGLGLFPGTLTAAYARNCAIVVNRTLDASPVATAVCMLMRADSAAVWNGEPTALFDVLSDGTPESTRRSPSWPKTTNALSRELRRCASFLRSVGISVELELRTGRGSQRRRAWRLTRTEDPVLPSVVGQETLAPVPAPRVDATGAGDQTVSAASNGRAIGSGGRGDGGDDAVPKTSSVQPDVALATDTPPSDPRSSLTLGADADNETRRPAAPAAQMEVPRVTLRQAEADYARRVADGTYPNADEYFDLRFRDACDAGENKASAYRIARTAQARKFELVDGSWVRRPKRPNGVSPDAANASDQAVVKVDESSRCDAPDDVTLADCCVATIADPASGTDRGVEAETAPSTTRETGSNP